MTTETTPAAPDNVADIESAARAKALADVKARNESIAQSFRPFLARAGVREIYDAITIDPSVTVEQARDRLLAKLGEGAEPLAADAPVRIQPGVDEADRFAAAATQSILARVGQEKTDRANPYRGMRLSDIARACLERAGARVAGLTADELAPLALTPGIVRGAQTTSDFPVILENTMHKLVLTGFQSAPTTYQRWCKLGDVTDFRAWNRIVPGVIGNLDSINEAGEYRQKTIPDGVKNAVTATRKGNIITITPEVLVNDDLAYIQTIASDLGAAGGRTVDRAAYTLLESNPTLSDGVALFHASHANLAGSGAVISTTTIDAAATAMAAQTSPGDDAEPLDLAPGVALVPRALRSLMIETVNAEFNDDSNKNQRKPNAVRGIVDDIVASTRLSSATAWYLFADPNVAPVVEVVFLNGQREPRIVMEEAFRSGGLSWRVELPFGVGAIDHRGAYKNPGA